MVGWFSWCFFGKKEKEKEKWGLENDGFRVENLGVIL